MTARVICVASGFSAAQFAGIKKEHILMLGQPVDLPSLSDADLCLTYGAEGTLLRFLLMGVPQLIAPRHVETYMAARRVAAAGLGAWLSGEQSATSISNLIQGMTAGGDVRHRAEAFAKRAVRTELRQIVSIAFGEEQRELPHTGSLRNGVRLPAEAAVSRSNCGGNSGVSIA